ncbi:MAG TPA: hotdog fold thioesterase [Intrasporangiaceae bacterium]|nr:hotdog fold thioesterase [Intrasporangiaceae bacterium]
MSITQSPSPEELVTWFNDVSAGTLVERMEIEFVEATLERVVARMPVAGNTQPYGLLHGGASVVLAETVGSMCAAMHAGSDHIVVGLDINATHHKATREGWVTGVATPLSIGRSASMIEIVISNEAGERVCTSRLTCLVRDKVPGQGSA